jgi:hypothetical protein
VVGGYQVFAARHFFGGADKLDFHRPKSLDSTSINLPQK